MSQRWRLQRYPLKLHLRRRKTSAGLYSRNCRAASKDCRSRLDVLRRAGKRSPRGDSNLDNGSYHPGRRSSINHLSTRMERQTALSVGRQGISPGIVRRGHSWLCRKTSKGTGHQSLHWGTGYQVISCAFSGGYRCLLYVNQRRLLEKTLLHSTSTAHIQGGRVSSLLDWAPHQHDWKNVSGAPRGISGSHNSQEDEPRSIIGWWLP